MSPRLALVKPALRRSAAPQPSPFGARVRPLEEDDLEAVADLFLQRFRGPQRTPSARAALAECMKTLYLDYPTRVGDADSLVAVDGGGDIGAFVGAMRFPFRLGDQTLTGCVTGTLMASPDPRYKLAVVQLLREGRKGDYDLIVTDSANRASLAMCQVMNYQVASPDSLEWACVFNPASLVLHKLGQRLGARLGALRPFAHALDLAAAAALRAAAPPARLSEWRDEPVDDETYIEAVAGLGEDCRLRPDLERAPFRWLLARARERESAGPLQLRVLFDPAGAPAGGYAAYGDRGDVCRVFHAVAAPQAWGKLFDRMRESARERGAVAVHGSLKKPMMAHAYAVRGVFFYYAGGTLVYSHRADVRRAVETGEALLGGFAGDRWTRLASDTFG